MKIHVRIVVVAILILGPVSVGSSVAQAQGRERRDQEQQAAPQDQSNSFKPSRIVRDPPEALRVEDMTMEELQQRLAEYEAGKRDDRDGYIILNQLWFNYQVRKAEQTPAAQSVNRKRLELLKKHPELNSLHDFRLSDSIRYERKLQQAKDAAAKAPQPWVPLDATPTMIKGSGQRAAVFYQFRIDFLKLQSAYQVNQTAQHGLMIRTNGQEMAPATLKPSKTMTFKRPFRVMPLMTDNVSSNILVCTDLLHVSYAPMTQEEREKLRANGFEGTMPWVNQQGKFDQLCAVISMNGDIMFSFPLTQKMPQQLLAPIGITADGTKAAVMVGERIQLDAEDGVESFVGRPREVLLWEAQHALRRIKITDRNLNERDLMGKFARGEF